MNRNTISLKFGNHFQTINTIFFELKQPTTIVKDFQIVLDQPYLFSAKHKALISTLDLTGITT